MSSESSPEREVIRQYLPSRKPPTSNTNQRPESQTELVLPLAVKSHKRNDGFYRPESPQPSRITNLIYGISNGTIRPYSACFENHMDGIFYYISIIEYANRFGGTKNLAGYAKTTEPSRARPTRKFLRMPENREDHSWHAEHCPEKGGVTISQSQRARIKI
jgi:hypothetical protein